METGRPLSTLLGWLWTVDSEFRYKPLKSTDSIRLLHLQPSSDASSQISITLSESRLQDAPAYEALSYTWGDGQDRRQVEVLIGDDSPEGKILSVTAHCHSALRRLRHESTERTLWVDAICINQGHIAERNSQVAQMGTIYRQASRVIVDVGEGDEDSDAAIDFIANFYYQTNTDDDKHNIEYKENIYDFSDGLELQRIVDKFYFRPWFSRVWVLQEVFLSQSAQLICGDKLADWKVFHPFRIWIDSRPTFDTAHWHVSMPQRVPLALDMNVASSGGQEQTRYTTAKDLLHILCQTRNFRATDPRDKIFALLPMMYFQQETEIVPVADYNKTTAQAYTETAAWLIPRVGLSLLSCASHTSIPDCSQEISGLPSWVPNWNSRYPPKWMISNPSNPVYYPLQACGKTHTSPVIDLVSIQHSTETSLGLQVRGLVTDEILKSSLDTPIRNDSSQETQSFLSSLRAHRRELSQTSPATLASLPPPPSWAPKTPGTRLHPPNWAAFEYGLTLKDPHTMRDIDVCDHVSFLCNRRQLMITESRGYVGIVPDAAREGDLVFVFYGGCLPFILRKVEGSGYYRLIGEAYVYGLMDGEGFRNLEENSGVQDFVII